MESERPAEIRLAGEQHRLAGRTAVITGGTSGLGLATARLFLSHGARVLAIGRNAERVSDVRARLTDDAAAAFPEDRNPGDRVRAMTADITSERDLSAIAAEAEQFLGARLDILFVNAGIGGRMVPFEECDAAQFDRIFGANCRGGFFTVQKLSPLMRDGSSVIFNLSTAHRRPAPGYMLYAASKAASRSLVRSLAVHLAPRGIRVNSVSPGVVPTEITREEEPSAVVAIHRAIAPRIPMQRLGRPEEVARAVLFLATGSESSYITGADLAVDGGLNA